MAFVNEFVSEEDIEKYDLDALWNRYNQRGEQMPALRLSGSYKHYWTIDRELDVWLMFAEIVYSQAAEFSRSGYPEPTREHIFILNMKEINYEIRLYKLESSSRNFAENPFKIEWKLLSIKPEVPNMLSENEVMLIIKDAITEFGYNGIKKSVPNTLATLIY